MTNALVLKTNENLLIGPVGSLDSYISTVTQIPILDRETEVELANRFREDRDLNAAKQLVISHLRFVVHIARGYSGYGLNMADIVQEGNIGLMKAVKRFDPSFGVRLVSFAVHWIRSEIHEFVLRNWRMVKVATTKAQRKLFFNLRKSKKNLSWLSVDDTKAIAKDLGVKVGDVQEMERRMSSADVSFNAVPTAGESDGYGPETYLPSDEDDPGTAVANEDEQRHQEQQLVLAMNSLDDRTRDIVQRRWLNEAKDTLTELANEYGVSAERIRQIEKRGLKLLKEHIA
ncbi:MAG: RNA polymerase sigma factor RpoH [Gammaproteobacteria bacterium]|nr:RNA polymerase sigma factor RpoH [Gammaproteobacteria bacterium]